MYNVGVGAPVILGVVLSRGLLPQVAGTGPAVQGVQAALAVTGFAVALYVAVAMALILIGLVLRHWGAQSSEA